MFKGIFIKLFRLLVTIISVNLLVVTMMNTNVVMAQTPLLSQAGSAKRMPVFTTVNSPNLPSPLDAAAISFQEIATGFTNPIFIANAGDGSGRLFVVEQAGYIRILKNGSLLGTPFLDIHTIIRSGGEQGLLALAFHPSYSTNGIFFVVYTAPRNGDATGSNLVLEKFLVSPNDPDLANPASGVILLTIDHPVNSNHNGGALAFGGDGFLYWSTGDGGGGDPSNYAQQLNNLLGKILRIDVNSGSPYGIPTSNPFYSSIDPTLKKEIWAYGFRNPWRFSFDGLTHDLYIGDVGQSTREEVDFQAAGSTGGENYGWRVMEGSLCYTPLSGCDQSGKTLPVAEYSHTLGCSITGGYVYRGLNFPSLNGYYFYGDYCSGRLFSLYNDPILGWTSAQLADTPFSISTFGEDEQGELYLADRGTGKLYNIRYQDPLIVKSIIPANPNPTKASSVDFTVTFSRDITGVDITGPQFDDFALAASPGISGAAVTGVNGSGAVYTVTVNTGSGEGTIRLDVPLSATITDLIGNPLASLPFTSGEPYTIDRTAPTTFSITRTEPNPNAGIDVDFTVRFDESVTGVDKSDFSLNITGITNTLIEEVRGNDSIYTVRVNTGTGNNGTIRLDMPNTATITDLAGNPLANLPFNSGAIYNIFKDATFSSTPANDGWTLESSEFSNRANIKNNTSTLRLGDDARNKQYRSLLYFDTSNLSNNADISKVIVKIKMAGTAGTDPFTTHGSLIADMKKGFFGLSPLELTDFNATGAPISSAGTFKDIGSDWYQLILSPANFKYVNLGGVTQFRLRFTKDDDNDKKADFISFFSGDDIANPPLLLVEYTTP